MDNSVLLDFSSAGTCTCACMGPFMASEAKNAPEAHLPGEVGGGVIGGSGVRDIQV